MSRLLAAVALCLAVAGQALGQDIRKHYVSKPDGDAVIYHTFPCTLFTPGPLALQKTAGDVTFDITYRDHGDGRATLNFTYAMDAMTPADSVRLASGRTVMRGPVEKLYIEPEKKGWKHRYSFSTDVGAFYTFFDESARPEMTIYSKGRPCLYVVKPAAWKTYAPIGEKIFQMIRVNE